MTNSHFCKSESPFWLRLLYCPYEVTNVNTRVSSNCQSLRKSPFVVLLIVTKLFNPESPSYCISHGRNVKVTGRTVSAYYRRHVFTGSCGQDRSHENDPVHTIFVLHHTCPLKEKNEYKRIVPLFLWIGGCLRRLFEGKCRITEN